MPFRLSPDADNRTIGLCIDKDWGFAIHCDCKTPLVRWYHADLVKPPREATLEQIAERLVCKVCGGNEGMISIFNGRSHPGYA